MKFIKTLINELITRINLHKQHVCLFHNYKSSVLVCMSNLWNDVQTLKSKHVVRQWNQKPEIKIIKNETK